MTETTTPTTTALTPEIVKSKLQILLTTAEQSIQALNDEESKLVYNEDNLSEISNFINGCKAAEKIVETERKAMKEPYLQAGRTVDDGAKLLSVELGNLRVKAYSKYEKLCQEVERKRREKEAEELRISTINQQMDTFRMEYAAKISEAKTSQELVSIERLVNLETGNSRKYMEFTEIFKLSCEPIRSQLREQKEKVRQLEELELSRQEAEKQGNDEKILELMEKQENLEAKISENAIKVQETAVSQATVAEAKTEEILPKIPKGGRQLWQWEVTDLKAAEKAGLTLTVINEQKVKEILAKKREDETECTENGIRYFILRKY